MATLLLLSLPVLVIGYAYVGYPAILWLIARKRPKTHQSQRTSKPLVTLVVPAYNEGAQIRGALEALLEQDYPTDRRQILIVSDASSDQTDAIVREYADRGVELLRMPQRCGKTAAENATVSHIRGDIVVNSDASVRLHPRATSLLVEALTDPTVGVASTRDVSIAVQDGTRSGAEANYVGYEMWVRSLETLAGGIIGASGSGYAIRASLHKIPVRDDLSRDFSAALTAHRHGFRAVSVDDAITAVPRTQSLRSEYRRKVRTISRGMDTLHFNRDLLNPGQHGLFAWKLFSHKLCRWLVPVSFLPVIVFALSLLALDSMATRMLIVALIVLSWITAKTVSRLSLGPFASGLGVLLANVAVLHAWWRFFYGHSDHIWEPTRRASEASRQSLN